MGYRAAIAALLVALAAGCKDDPTPAPPASSGTGAVVVMIGDGMGRAQLDAAGIYAHGEPGTLFMESLPVRGTVDTTSVMGVTDSAAAATAMACGVRCANRRVGEDVYGRAAANAVELAHAQGWRTGIATTSSLTHATPAAFTTHQRSRYDMAGIAEDQVTGARPHVMLGGGTRYYAGLVDDIEAGGYTLVRTRAELAAAVAAGADRVFGLFADNHMTMERARPPDTAEPTLPEMTRAALRVLGRDGASFFLVVEGGRIDHGGHHNSIEDVIAETLAFDESVRLVAEWAAGRDDVTIIVTGDHETGGLTIVENLGAGITPRVTWRTREHTDADVPLFGLGPGLAPLDGQRRDHTAIFTAARARIEGRTGR